MIRPALPKNESERLKALFDYDVLDTPNEAGFDQLTRLAAHIAGTPFALVSLLDTKRQWFKSCFGIDIKESDRNISFCGHAILQDEPLIINDARTDIRFALNPFVAGPMGIRFYAGIPIVTSTGYKLGTLCVIDTQARWLTREQVEALQNLAAQVMDQLEARKKLRQLEAAQSLLVTAIKEARQADNARNSFFANMSHDIRTPLNGIIGMTGLLVDAEENPEKKVSLDVIRTCSERLLKFIDDRLDSPTAAATKIELEPRRVIETKLTAEDPKDPEFKVLVAEDNLVNQKVVAAYLRKLGYEPDIVENGRDALERLQAQDYAVVFMDCQMPIMDGYHTTDAILRNFPQNRIPYIVALTANATELDRNKCIAAGMHDFVSKPFRMRDLKRVLDVLYANFKVHHEPTA